MGDGVPCYGALEIVGLLLLLLRNPPGTVGTNQVTRSVNRNAETEQLAQKFGELQNTFSTILHRQNFGDNSGVKRVSPPVIVRTTTTDPQIITSINDDRHHQGFKANDTEHSRVTTTAEIHAQPNDSATVSSKSQKVTTQNA